MKNRNFVSKHLETNKKIIKGCQLAIIKILKYKISIYKNLCHIFFCVQYVIIACKYRYPYMYSQIVLNVCMTIGAHNVCK